MAVNTVIVTIDGPAGSGKSTAARWLAERLGFRFLDTGAMYRAVGVECLRRNIDLNDRASAGRVAHDVQIQFVDDRIICDDRDVTEAIRSAEASQAASVVAQIPEVRSALVDQQRQIADDQNVVTEGRDQGTVAFPHAEFKFFLTADAKIRALRRQLELEQQGVATAFEDVLSQIRERDARDAQRAIAPLKPADDALTIDTTHMSIEDVVVQMQRIVRTKAR